MVAPLGLGFDAFKPPAPPAPLAPAGADAPTYQPPWRPGQSAAPSPNRRGPRCRRWTASGKRSAGLRAAKQIASIFCSTSVCLLSQYGSSQDVLCSGGLVDPCSPHQSPVVLAHRGAFYFLLQIFRLFSPVGSKCCLTVALILLSSRQLPA